MVEKLSIPWMTKLITFPARKALSISQQPLELQKIYAPKFGVALGALLNGHNKFDLRSP